MKLTEYSIDINIGPGYQICAERERVGTIRTIRTIRRIKSEVKAFQARVHRWTISYSL